MEVLRKNFLASIVPVIVNAVLNAHQLVVDIIAFVSRGDFPRSRLGEKQRGKILAAWVQRKMRTIAQFGIKDPDSDSQSMMTETAGPRGSNSLRNGGSSLKQVESTAALGDLHEDYAPLPAGFSEMPASMPGDNNSMTESPPPALAELRAIRSADDDHDDEHDDENDDNNHDDTPVVPPLPSSSAPVYNFNTTTAYSPIELPTNPFDDEEIHRRFETPSGAQIRRETAASTVHGTAAVCGRTAEVSDVGVFVAKGDPERAVAREWISDDDNDDDNDETYDDNDE